MDEQRQAVRVAVGLMRAALARLDRAGAGRGAARLQHAIDTVLAERPLRPDEEFSPETACLLAGIPLSDTGPTGASEPTCREAPAAFGGVLPAGS